MRILIVDDDDISLEFLTHSLEKAGHSVAIARDGVEALAWLRRDTFPMVITDWDMPRLDGVALCRAIRNLDAPHYTYLIVLTSYKEKSKVVEGIEAGADDFISKPFNPEELVVRVRAGERILALESRDVTIFALAKLAESRDQETGFHLERVRNYARVLAQNLHEQGEPEADIHYVRMIFLTSPLHDIGKVAIPDAILRKAGRLTPEEFAVMQTHTTLGAETLDAALREHPGAGFLRMARDIAATHHEKFDGSGYPKGLDGDRIPLCGRIVAVADVYDALASKRIYKPAIPHVECIAQIAEQSGRHFDPKVVRALLACQWRINEIRMKYEEPGN